MAKVRELRGVTGPRGRGCHESRWERVPTGLEEHRWIAKLKKLFLSSEHVSVYTYSLIHAEKTMKTYAIDVNDDLSGASLWLVFKFPSCFSVFSKFAALSTY